MADGKLAIDQRLDRIELAIGVLAKKTRGKSMQKKIEKILQGEKLSNVLGGDEKDEAA